MPTTFKLGIDNFPVIDKDPDANLDYQIDWADASDSWLGSDTIAGTPVWTVPAGITKGAETNTTTTATVWLSGGTAGTTYKISCKITTAAGRIDERSFNVRIIQR